MKRLLFLFILLQGSLKAQDVWPESPLVRIAPKAKIAQNYVLEAKGMSAGQKMNYFDDEHLRDQLRDLQNLFMLYSYTYDDPKGTPNRKRPFKKLYKETKKFEDHISHLRDREMNKHEFPEAYEAEVKAYTEFLKTSSWFKIAQGNSAFVTRIKKIVKKKKLGPVTKDRNVLLHGFKSKLMKLAKKELDFNHSAEKLATMKKADKYQIVEDNIHEARRVGRRLSYLNYGTLFEGGDYLIEKSREIPCPIGKALPPARYNPRAYHRNLGYTCPVSICLTDALDSITMQFSGYRSYAARAISSKDDERLAEVFQEAKKSYQKLENNHIFRHIVFQISMCMKQK